MSQAKFLISGFLNAGAYCMAKRLPVVARMNLLQKKISELFDLIGTIRKVQLIPTFRKAVSECWNVRGNALEIVLAIVNNCPWTGLVVVVIGRLGGVGISTIPVFDRPSLSLDVIILFGNLGTVR